MQNSHSSPRLSVKIIISFYTSPYSKIFQYFVEKEKEADQESASFHKLADDKFFLRIADERFLFPIGEKGVEQK